MKKATLGIGLQSEREDWFTSSSVADGIPREWIRQVSEWAFHAGCRRLRDGGWDAERIVTLSVMSHADVTRIMDEAMDVETRFRPTEARQIMEHLFAECMALVFQRRP